MSRPCFCWILLALTYLTLGATLPLHGAESELPSGVAEVELGPPGFQEGDDGLYEVTVGQLRQSVWYRAAFEVAWRALKGAGVEYRKIEEAYATLLEMYGKKDLEAKENEIARDTWRGVAIISIGVTGLSLVVLTVLSILK